MKEHSVSLLLLAILTFFWFSYGQTSGKYDVFIKEVVRCEDSGTEELSFTSTRLTKVSRHTFNYETNYTLKIPLDDSLSAVSDLQAWGNGGWRPGFFTLDTPHLCTGCKNLNPQWFHLLIQNTGVDDCPIPPGDYQVTAYNVSFAEFTVPMFTYGRYKMINQIYKKDVIVGCIGMVVDVMPKRKSINKKKKN